MAKENKVSQRSRLLKLIQEKTSTELKKDGHMQDLRYVNVLYKLKSEENCKDRLSLKSIDLSDLMELWVQEQELKDPFLRYVSLPLTAIMYTSEDLEAMTGQKPIVLHLDATGSVVRKPQYLKCKRILYYCILAKHDVEIIKLAHMITSTHGIVSISTFLKQYKYFVLETNKKWPLAKWSCHCYRLVMGFHSFSSARMEFNISIRIFKCYVRILFE